MKATTEKQKQEISMKRQTDRQTDRQRQIEIKRKKSSTVCEKKKTKKEEAVFQMFHINLLTFN